MMKLENGASEEAGHVIVPLCGQWHGRRTTCVSSLTSIGSLVRGRANKDLFRAGWLIARAQKMSDCWQYCNVACVQLDMYVSSCWCQFCKYAGKQSAIAASGCSNGGEVSQTLDGSRSEHG